jgi:hypothetical protein
MLRDMVIKAIKMLDSDIYDEIYRTNMLSPNNSHCGGARFLRELRNGGMPA